MSRSTLKDARSAGRSGSRSLLGPSDPRGIKPFRGNCLGDKTAANLNCLISRTQNSNGLVTAPSLFRGFSETFLGNADSSVFSSKWTLISVPFVHHGFSESWRSPFFAVAAGVVLVLPSMTLSKHWKDGQNMSPCPRNSKASRVPWTWHTSPRITVFMLTAQFEFPIAWIAT